MMELAGTTQRIKALCQAVDTVCKPLHKHGPATAAHVRATSIQLSRIIKKYWGQEEETSAAYKLLVNSNFSSNLVDFLLWSLPHLSHSLLEASHDVTQAAWGCAQFLVQSVVYAAAALARDESGRAAGMTLLEQLQPANDISKPGKHQHRSG
jgi:hypothetical protein